MIRITFAELVLALAACGADGPPTRPGPGAEPAPEPGLAVSGEARIGVVSTL